MPNHRYRITFGKGPQLRFIGHLDLHRVWERTFSRAQAPIAYTGGFRPRPRINIGAALPLGSTSDADLLDVELVQEVERDPWREELGSRAPAGLSVTDIQPVEDGTPKLQKLITAAEYSVALDPEVARVLVQRIQAILDLAALPRMRRGKDYDLRPLVEKLELRNGTLLWMRLSSRSGATGRPDEVLMALDVDPVGLVPHRHRLVLTQ